MSELLHLLRAVVRDELRALRLGETAVVTATAPHAEGGTQGYSCDVKLRHSGLELRGVPMLTPHVGLASPPRVGDLTLVQFIDGDVNRPVLVGRLYSDQAEPPPHADDELWLSMPPEHTTQVALLADGAVKVAAGKTVLTVAKDGDVTLAGEGALQVTIRGDATIKADGNVEITCADAAVKASGNVKLGDGGGGVITTQTHKCYYTGAPLVGSQTVTAKG